MVVFIPFFFIYLFIYLIKLEIPFFWQIWFRKSKFIYLLFIFKIVIQYGRFSIYIFTKYIKIIAFQTSPVEKESNKRLNFTFQHQISGRN